MRCVNCNTHIGKNAADCYRCGHAVGERTASESANRTRTDPIDSASVGFAVLSGLFLVLFFVAAWNEIDAAHDAVAALTNAFDRGEKLGIADYITLAGRSAGYLAASIACFVGFRVVPLFRVTNPGSSEPH